MKATRDLWAGIAPAALAGEAGALRVHLDTLAWLSDVDPGSPLAARLAVVHLDPSGATAASLAEALAAREHPRAGHAWVSHVGLGWLVVAAALGDRTAGELVTAAHLRQLRGCRERSIPDDPALLGVIERCARNTGGMRAVRDFTRAALEGTASDLALDALISDIDPEQAVNRYIAGDPPPAALLPRTGLAPFPSLGSVGAPSRLDLARRMLQLRLPWLEAAIDALCPPSPGPQAPMPPLPVLISGPAGSGQDDLVRALSELVDIAYVALNARDLGDPIIEVPEAVKEVACTGARHVMIKLAGVDRLNAAAASRLACALQAESLLPRDGNPTGRKAWHGLVMLAEDAERVPDDLRRSAKVVPVDIPGAAYGAHVAELIGTVMAIEWGLPRASELPVSEPTWADLRRRVAVGANLNEIRTELAEACDDPDR